MDNIYVIHEDQQIGPFAEEKIRRYLEEGRIQPTTLAWVEGAADWKPISEMLGLASAQPAPVQAPPQPQAQPQQLHAPAYAAPQAPQQNHQANPKKLILASWLMIGVTCLVALIPGIGFLTWIIAFPVLLVTFILGILTLTKGRTLQGVLILLMSLIAAPVFLMVAPIITTAGAVAATDSGSSGSSFIGSTPGPTFDRADPEGSSDRMAASVSEEKRTQFALAFMSLGSQAESESELNNALHGKTVDQIIAMAKSNEKTNSSTTVSDLEEALTNATT